MLSYSCDRERIEGAEIIEELQADPEGPVVRKERYGAFCGSDLGKVLRGRQVGKVEAVGFGTSACVTDTVGEPASGLTRGLGFSISIPHRHLWG